MHKGYFYTAYLLRAYYVAIVNWLHFCFSLLRDEVADALASIHCDPLLLAFEIVEYNPYHNRHLTTAHAVHDLCQSLIQELG